MEFGMVGNMSKIDIICVDMCHVRSTYVSDSSAIVSRGLPVLDPAGESRERLDPRRLALNK